MSTSMSGLRPSAMLCQRRKAKSVNEESVRIQNRLAVMASATRSATAVGEFGRALSLPRREDGLGFPLPEGVGVGTSMMNAPVWRVDASNALAGAEV